MSLQKYTITFRFKVQGTVDIEVDRPPWITWHGDLILRNGKTRHLYCKGHWKTCLPYVEPPFDDSEAARYVRNTLAQEAAEKAAAEREP